MFILEIIDDALKVVKEKGLVSTIAKLATNYGKLIMFFTFVGVIVANLILIINGKVLEKGIQIVGVDAFINGVISSLIFIVLFIFYKKFLYYSKNEEVIKTIRRRGFSGKSLSYKDMKFLVLANHIMLCSVIGLSVASYTSFYNEKEIRFLLMHIGIIFILIILDTRYRAYADYMTNEGMKKEKTYMEYFRLANILFLSAAIVIFVRIFSENFIGQYLFRF